MMVREVHGGAMTAKGARVRERRLTISDYLALTAKALLTRQ